VSSSGILRPPAERNALHNGDSADGIARAESKLPNSSRLGRGPEHKARPRPCSRHSSRLNGDISSGQNSTVMRQIHREMGWPYRTFNRFGARTAENLRRGDPVEGMEGLRRGRTLLIRDLHFSRESVSNTQISQDRGERGDPSEIVTDRRKGKLCARE